MNRSLQEYFRCIINGNDTNYTEWPTDVGVFPLAYNSQITTTLGLSPYEKVFNQKPRLPIMFTAKSSKNTQGSCQLTKESICYNLPIHTHTMKINFIIHKFRNKTPAHIPTGFTIHTSYNFKNWNLCLNSKFCNTKRISKKLQPIRKGPFQIIDKPTDVRYKLNDSNKKKLFNTETIFYHTTQKNTLFAN